MSDLEKIRKMAEISEAYFVSLLWFNPENYYLYEGQIDSTHFITPSWEFMFNLGKELNKRGYKKFDDITVYRVCTELGIDKQFEKFGGYDSVNEVMEVVTEYEENIDTYFNEVRKNRVILDLYDLFGKKVLKKTDKYDYTLMNINELTTYWNDKVNLVALDTGSKFDEYNLIGDADEYIKRVKEQAQDGLMLYSSKLWNKITNGIHKGHVFMFGGFGNAGKSSILFEKYVMGCIIAKEKLVVLANEEDIKAFQDKMVVTVLSHELKERFDRNKLVTGELTEDDEELIRKAFKHAKELVEGDESLVKFVSMENYIMDDVKKIIRHFYNRGYENYFIDTHKVSDQSAHKDRWVTFVEDMKTIYKLTRPNANGLNLRMVVNFQLVDTAINTRYLDFDAIGEGKASKNEASVVWMFRSVFSSEYEGGNDEIEGYRYVKDEEKGGYKEKKFKLEKGKTYYLLFTPKNRFGSNNTNGQPVLIIEPNFHFNSFKEIGWCSIPKN